MTQEKAIEKLEKVTELLEEIYDLLDEVHYDYVLPHLETKDGETNNQLRHDVINSLEVAKLDIDEMIVFLKTIPLDMVEGYPSICSKSKIRYSPLFKIKRYD